MRIRTLATTCLMLVAISAAGCGRDTHVSPGPQVLNFAGTTWQVTDGKWQVDGDTLSGSGGHLMTTEQFGDGSFDVEVETPAMGDRTVGIGFRVTGSEGQNGYAFNFTAAQTFNVFKGTANNWQPVNPAATTFQHSDVLQPNRNALHLEMAGDRYRVWVNGQQLADFQDATYTKGHYNLWVESSGWTVKFTNLRIKSAAV